jgi:hypothetical protein
MSHRYSALGSLSDTDCPGVQQAGSGSRRKRLARAGNRGQSDDRVRVMPSRVGFGCAPGEGGLDPTVSDRFAWRIRPTELANTACV